MPSAHGRPTIATSTCSRSVQEGWSPFEPVAIVGRQWLSPASPDRSCLVSRTSAPRSVGDRGRRGIRARPAGRSEPSFDRSRRLGLPFWTDSEALHQALFWTVASQASAPSIGINRTPAWVLARATPVGRDGGDDL